MSHAKEELDGGGRVLGSFILRSAQQEEALHRIWYALRRWRLVSRRIVLFPTTAYLSIYLDILSAKTKWKLKSFSQK
ncbi:unnamed protein product [Spirodela intermedia]|uniref:Uncharacterized protein n=1 Tax=Spirodela intermedia TaxID=51605 RepID=A0ABN7EDG4_SPIIN|nr:unnamed protein product [Spirodela intermedia]